MDEIELLTQRLGLKSSRKGAPMAASKNSRFTPESELDLALESLHDPTRTSSLSGVDVDDADTLFDSWNESFSKEIDDFFRSFESNSEQKAPMGGFVDVDAQDWAYGEELIPGFGGSSRPDISQNQEEEEAKRRLESTCNGSKFNSESSSSPLLDEQIAELNDSSKASSSTFGSSQVDSDINRWASGKQGNLRALLSTLHYVVGDACGWKPVSMADLVASSSVNKFYKKAMLCVHPDKVQQRGANFQHMYTSLKVFHILKEAHNKFSWEEPISA